MFMTKSSWKRCWRTTRYSEAEYSFMLGREKVGKKKKKGLGLERREHEDTQSVELAKGEYEED